MTPCGVIFNSRPVLELFVMKITKMFITSSVSGQGKRIGPVCVSTKSGIGVHLDNISDEFRAQRHRSKVTAKGHQVGKCDFLAHFSLILV